MKPDVYESVTHTILDAMDQQNGQWILPWDRGLGIPRNAATQQPYHGVNVVRLWSDMTLSAYQSHFYATYQQWQHVGGQVKKGEKGAMVVFYKALEIDEEDENGDPKTQQIPLIRYSKVFNAEQQDGWEIPTVEQQNPVEIIEHVRQFVQNTDAHILHGGNKACYLPSTDTIRMPPMESFLDTPTSTATENYFSTQLHEVSHWSGHSSRLDRDLSGAFGSESYAEEELRAELAAAMLCAELEITKSVRQDHIQYIDHWRQKLSEDKKAIFRAAAAAQKIVGYLEALQDNQEVSGLA